MFFLCLACFFNKELKDIKINIYKNINNLN